MISALRLIQEARKCIGVPYRHGGRSLEGMDCFGPIVVPCLSLGIPIRDVGNYAPHQQGEALLAPLRVHCDELPLGEARPGCVAVFWVDGRSKAPQHAGLITDKGFIHCWTASGKVVEQEMSSAWRRRMCHVFQIRGVC